MYDLPSSSGRLRDHAGSVMVHGCLSIGTYEVPEDCKHGGFKCAIDARKHHQRERFIRESSSKEFSVLPAEIIADARTR